MVRRSFGQVKAQLARVAGATGMSMADARIKDYLNAATEELMQKGDWASIIDRYRFRVIGGLITLPQNYERIMYMKIDGVRMQMQSPWFEFIGYGPELISEANAETLDAADVAGLLGTLDREDVCVFKDIPDPSLGVQYTLRVAATTTEDDNTTIIVQGLDGNKQWIRSEFNGEWIDGVAFVLAGSPQAATSPQVFSEIQAVIKPVTNQPVNCYYIPVGGTAQTQIARWEAAETNPSYRRYKVPGLNCDQEYCVFCRVRRRFAPVLADGDILLIGNLPALKAMMQAVYYGEANEVKDYAEHLGIAMQILKDELKAYVGSQNQKPLITFSGGLAGQRRGLYVQ